MEQVEQLFFQCAFIKVGANFQTLKILNVRD